jgi:hypothetical protein
VAIKNKSPEDPQGGHMDMDIFNQDWIQNAGMNAVHCKWNPGDKSANAKLVCEQTAVSEGFPTLRYHVLKIGFFGDNGELLETKKIVLKRQAQTVVEYDGRMNIAAVVPNVDDLAFIKIVLDEVSFWRLKIRFP